MAAPNTKKFSTIVSDFAAAGQAQSQAPLTFAIGSILRAVAEATAGVADWLQKLYLFALSVTRLRTSAGIWVDSFVGDFTLTRLPAIPATGLVTFSRYYTTSQAYIKVGTVVATADGTQIFTVYADPTLAAYVPVSVTNLTDGYAIPVGVASLNIPVQAVTVGSAGNVNASTITSLRSAVTGVDSVLNPAPFTNGLDAETDDALKARFVLFIASLSKATDGAIGYAIVSLRQGLQYSIVDTVGLVTVYVDDGSGAIASSLVIACQTAVNAVRAGGVQAVVLAATKVNATVTMSISIAAGYDAPSVRGLVGAAVGSYINNLGIDATLHYTRIEQVAYNASAGVVEVTDVVLNGGTSNLVGTPATTIKAANISVN